ncbi:MAG: ThiF family adenylyltransferase [Alphaproteobacteria bacterium]|nr:ThiF family adenylyltransferase [Alphaproteobacteria bacterium]
MASVVVTIDDPFDSYKLWCLRTIIELVRRSTHTTDKPARRILVCTERGLETLDESTVSIITNAGGDICLPQELPKHHRTLPMLAIGSALSPSLLPCESGFFRSVQFVGWHGGISRDLSETAPSSPEVPTFPLSPLVAGAVAVCALHQHCFDVDSAPRDYDSYFLNLREFVAGTKLPASMKDRNWSLPTTHIHIVGLGQLGQAYCWALKCLEELGGQPLPAITLQDFDEISPSNFSTSLLVDEIFLDPRGEGILKTELCKEFLCQCDTKLRSQITRIDKLFSNKTVDVGEKTYLGGVDNLEARRKIVTCRNGKYFDVALGGHINDTLSMYYSLIVRSFDSSNKTTPVPWQKSNAPDTKELNQDHSGHPAIEELRSIEKQSDYCGIHDTAGALPFMGVIGACLMLSQWIIGDEKKNKYFNRSLSLINKNAIRKRAVDNLANDN